jgi:hypothetical protein
MRKFLENKPGGVAPGVNPGPPGGVAPGVNPGPAGPKQREEKC